MIEVEVSVFIGSFFFVKLEKGIELEWIETITIIAYTKRKRAPSKNRHNVESWQRCNLFGSSCLADYAAACVVVLEQRERMATTNSI